jgi:hypothetical protein
VYGENMKFEQILLLTAKKWIIQPHIL